MIQQIVEYIDTQLALTGYFQKQYGLVELNGIPGNQAPRKYCGNGEWKDVLDIDAKSGSVYIRRNGNISVSENDGQNMISCGKMYDISIPLKVVCFIRRNYLSADDEFSVDRASDTVMKYVAQHSNTLAGTIKAKRVNIGLSGKQLSPTEVLRAEKQQVNREIPLEYILFSIDLNIVVTSRRECIVEECDDVDACANLKAYLTQEQKDCVLNGYDFSVTANVNRLTAQQQTDLENALCADADPATVTVNGAAFGTVACAGTLDVPVENTEATALGSKVGAVWQIPDTTVEIYIDSVFQSSTTVPTLKTETINVNWT